MSDPQALHVTRNVIPGKLGVDLHLHRVHIPLVCSVFVTSLCDQSSSIRALSGTPVCQLRKGKYLSQCKENHEDHDIDYNGAFFIAKADTLESQTETLIRISFNSSTIDN